MFFLRWLKWCGTSTSKIPFKDADFFWLLVIKFHAVWKKCPARSLFWFLPLTIRRYAIFDFFEIWKGFHLSQLFWQLPWRRIKLCRLWLPRVLPFRKDQATYLRNLQNLVFVKYSRSGVANNALRHPHFCWFRKGNPFDRDIFIGQLGDVPMNFFIKLNYGLISQNSLSSIVKESLSKKVAKRRISIEITPSDM